MGKLILKEFYGGEDMVDLIPQRYKQKEKNLFPDMFKYF